MTDGLDIFRRLFVLEMANNHMGDLEHGLRIIREMRAVSSGYPELRIAVKLQYRELDSFIHPDFKGRSDIKYVKRFLETRLSAEDRKALRDEIKRLGMVAVCTAFDEPSVDLIEEHGFDVLKIGSCSFTDWPLLERVAKAGLPLIASTAGATLEDIDNVVAFLSHRDKRFALMHCVGEYPTREDALQLNQIDLLRARYPGVPIGYSTHEEPGELTSIQLAVAKGAELFEKHVGVATGKHALNAYSATPEQAGAWLAAARRAYSVCGVGGERRKPSDKELHDLRGLQRGVFARVDVRKGERVSADKIFLAIPNADGQLVANELSKYNELTAEADIPRGGPVLSGAVSRRYLRDKVTSIIRDVSRLLAKSKVPVSDRVDMELSHHFGIDRFHEWGATIFNVVNREYCKKLLIMLPRQQHPVHHHQKKDETFHVLYGALSVTMDGERKEHRAGDIIVVERGRRHSFGSERGAVIEEISTTHYGDDSYYDDETIARNKERKTYMTFWADWLTHPERIR